MTTENLLGVFLAKVREEPDCYEANQNLALEMMKHSRTTVLAEPYIRKALSLDTSDPERHQLIGALANVHAIKGNMGEAVRCLASLSTDHPAYLPQLGEAYFNAGDIAAASRIFSILIPLNHEVARQRAAARRGPVAQLLHPSHIPCIRFGEMASKLDLYVKARVLGMTPEVNAILLTPKDTIVNHALMDYWRRAANRHITIVSDERQIEEIRNTFHGLHLFLDWYEMPDGQALHRQLSFPLVQRRWEEEGRPPLLNLSEDHVRRGRARFKELGMPDDAWFVSLHVRSEGFHDEEVPWDHNRHRNSDIASYYPAIEEIIRRGGWVVRIGDASMPDLPAMKNVIDYANSPVCCDWMDLFCCSQCRFLVGTASGPAGVANAFGVPTLLVNMFPLGLWWSFFRGDMFIHKLLRWKESGRCLDIHEATRPPLPGLHAPLYYTTRGIEVIDNSAGDIAAAMVEMLDRLQGRRLDSPEERRLRQRFKEMADYCGVDVPVAVGMDFLRNNPFLLGEHA